jgi:hypothetical protein
MDFGDLQGAISNQENHIILVQLVNCWRKHRLVANSRHIAHDILAIEEDFMSLLHFEAWYQWGKK